MTQSHERKKKKAKLAALQDKSTEELVAMLGKQGRAKHIRAIIFSRHQAQDLLLGQKTHLSTRNMALYERRQADDIVQQTYEGQRSALMELE